MSKHTTLTLPFDKLFLSLGESIPIRLFLSGYELTPTMRDINKKFSVRYYLNLVLVDEEERRYFKQQVRQLSSESNGPFLSPTMVGFKLNDFRMYIRRKIVDSNPN